MLPSSKPILICNGCWMQVNSKITGYALGRLRSCLAATDSKIMGGFSGEWTKINLDWIEVRFQSRKFTFEHQCQFKLSNNKSWTYTYNWCKRSNNFLEILTEYKYFSFSFKICARSREGQRGTPLDIFHSPPYCTQLSPWHDAAGVQWWGYSWQGVLMGLVQPLRWGICSQLWAGGRGDH